MGIRRECWSTGAIVPCAAVHRPLRAPGTLAATGSPPGRNFPVDSHDASR